MLNFPQSTQYNRKIPKQRFYENIPLKPTHKRIWIEQIESILWKYKLSPATLSLPEGKTVKEIQVIEIRLSEPRLDESVLHQIDRAIPYHLLFLLVHEEKAKATIAHKEITVTEKISIDTSRYYSTEWMAPASLALPIHGIDLEEVYKNFVLQIAGNALTKHESGSLSDIVRLSEEKEKLQKQIAGLERKIRNEKQFNRQAEMHRELRILKKQLEEYSG